MHTRLSHLEPTLSGQVTHQAPHTHTSTTTNLPKLFDTNNTQRTNFQEWERFHSTYRNKHTKSNKMERQKNMPQMKTHTHKIWTKTLMMASPVVEVVGPPCS